MDGIQNEDFQTWSQIHHDFCGWSPSRQNHGRFAIFVSSHRYFGRRRRALTSPVLQAEEVVEVVADERRDLLQVVGSDPGRQERLVGVSEGGVHQQQPWVGAHGLGEALRAVAQEHIAETHRRLAWGRS